MKTIWKFPFTIQDRQQIEIPVGAVSLAVGLDADGTASLWALVEDQKPKRKATILVFGTGRPIPDQITVKHLGTLLMPPFVWHVFLETEN